MRQLPLDLGTRTKPSFDNFVTGDNEELLARLRALCAPGGYDMLYLWGPAGSGRSHLLHAAENAARAAARPVWTPGAPAARPIHADEADAPAPGAVVIADDVERLPPPAQIALFRAINTAPLAGLALLVAGAEPPATLALREDLRTRLAAMLVFEVRPLSEADKAQALLDHAAGRGLHLERELVGYLLRHVRRDLPSLLAVLDELDRACLARKRAPSLPLLRELLRGATEDSHAS